LSTGEVGLQLASVVVTATLEAHRRGGVSPVSFGVLDDRAVRTGGREVDRRGRRHGPAGGEDVVVAQGVLPVGDQVASTSTCVNGGDLPIDAPSGARQSPRRALPLIASTSSSTSTSCAQRTQAAAPMAARDDNAVRPSRSAAARISERLVTEQVSGPA